MLFLRPSVVLRQEESRNVKSRSRFAVVVIGRSLTIFLSSASRKIIGWVGRFSLLSSTLDLFFVLLFCASNRTEVLIEHFVIVV